MKVKIFFGVFDRFNRFRSVEGFEKKINEFLAEHPGSTIQWHQSSAGNASPDSVIVTTITAIISY